MDHTTRCEVLEGNSDFYGRGIRVGIYLQWISSWVSILVEPSTAQGILELNSVFVFAILVATIAAYNSAEIQPIETWIMLQFSFGFLLTTMSTFGFRLQLLRSEMVVLICDEIRMLPRRLEAALVVQRSQLSEQLRNNPNLRHFFGSGWIHLGLQTLLEVMTNSIQINLGVLAFLKPSSLAWSGVLWRSEIAGVLAGLNIAFWFYGVKADSDEDGCSTIVFLFSSQPLRSSLVTFFRVGAVIAGICIFPQTLFLALISIRLTVFLLMCIYRDIIFGGHSDTQEKLRKAFEQVVSRWRVQADDPDYFALRVAFSALSRANVSTAASRFLFRLISPFRTGTDILEFLLSSEVQDIRFSDILKLCASLSSGNLEVERVLDAPTAEEAHGEDSDNDTAIVEENIKKTSKSTARGIMIAWNALVLLAIIWFILSIELTILWNNIQGVSTIKSTGQLIPFIIGVTSITQAFQTIAVTIIKEKYPDWTNVKLVASQDNDGFTNFQIIKRDPAEDEIALLNQGH